MPEKLIPSYVKVNNFGDKLNKILIEKTFCEFLDDSSNECIDKESSKTKVWALGSWLSRDMLLKCNSSNKGIVVGLGSGYLDFPVIRTYGFGRKFPAKVSNIYTLEPGRLAERGKYYAIYWVRGPLTARLLGLPEGTAIADAGYMIRQLDIFNRFCDNKRSGVAFMPHITSAGGVRYWPDVCNSLGIDFIDPFASVNEVLEKISSSRLLITEALHGAVISDAMRVPWIPVKTSDDIFEFKWRDFCASIGINYSPFPIRVAWDIRFFTGRNPKSLSKYFSNRIRSKISQALVSQGDTTYDLLIASSIQPCLSSNSKVHEIDENIKKRLEKCLDDCKFDRVFVK